MILLTRINLSFLLLFIFFNARSQENDIFSEKNTSDFARFLFLANQYKYAAEEYERLAFLYPEKEEYQLGLLKSYRFAAQYRKGILAYKAFNSYQNVPSINVRQEYVKLNLLDGNKINLASIMAQSETESNFRQNLDLTLRLISYPKQELTLDGIETDRIDAGLLNLYYESSNIKHRSPFLAASFSTLIPGSGKIYSGRWTDGLIAFLFIGGTSFAAFRGFEKKGVESAYGWIMGSVSLGFYLGNIYGSAKAAKVFNSRQNAQYIEKVTDYYIDHF